MKRITFILVIALLFIQLQATVKFQLGAGVDLNGHHTFSNDTLGEDSDVNPGISIYGEVLSSRPLAIGDLMFGLGMEYQIPRELKLLSPAQHRRRYSYLPIYATVKYVLLPTAITPEAIVQGGYNFLVNHKNFEVDDSYNLSANGGFYWAAGIGLDIRPAVLQLMYKSNRSSFEWNDVDLGRLRTNNTNTQLSLQLGVRL